MKKNIFLFFLSVVFLQNSSLSARQKENLQLPFLDQQETPPEWLEDNSFFFPEEPQTIETDQFNNTDETPPESELEAFSSALAAEPTQPPNEQPTAQGQQQAPTSNSTANIGEIAGGVSGGAIAIAGLAGTYATLKGPSSNVDFTNKQHTEEESPTPSQKNPSIRSSKNTQINLQKNHRIDPEINIDDKISEEYQEKISTKPEDENSSDTTNSKKITSTKKIRTKKK